MEVIIVFAFLAGLVFVAIHNYHKGMSHSLEGDMKELHARRQAEMAERSVAKAAELMAEKMKARDSQQAFEARVSDEVLRRMAVLQQAQAQAQADAEARLQAMQQNLERVTEVAIEQAVAKFNGKVAETKDPAAEAKTLQPWAEAKAKQEREAQAQEPVPSSDADEAEAEAEANTMARNRYQAARDGDEPVEEQEELGQQLEPASYDADQDFPDMRPM